MPREKCKLCLRVSDLQKSHLLPASLFKKSRTSGASNPNPMFVTEKRGVQTSHQLRDFVLCRDCEQLLSRKGEAYTMTQVFDGSKFPLLDTLHTSTPTWGGPEFVGYDLLATPSIDRDQLGYFALSVFWRASVHIWRERGEKPLMIDLGEHYNEALRQYLLGQAGFPPNVVLLVIACTDALSRDSFYTPSMGRKGTDRTYSFMAKGINFLMIVGKQMQAPEIKGLCAVTGQRRMILSRSCEAKVTEAFRRLMRTH
jgi:hypothetical protein